MSKLRVIELSDTISKMELRRQFKVDDAYPERSAGEFSDSRRNVGVDDDETADIMSRLPPGTILIKQSLGNANSTSTTATSTTTTTTTTTTMRSSSRDDSDYVHESSKDSTETNSSGSSSAASYSATGKVKRMQHRNVRSQKIVEVRRNPIRNKKKKPIDEEFPRPRQRLLSVKRKAGFAVDPVPRKRAKPTTTPYMNTRSVTRKMYNVGATYQAPTIHDATEWREWPVHGMHERPIWHPQVGLAFEYIDRQFVSLDGRTYRQIIDEPVIEVVSVDPHPERMSLLSGRRQFERIISKNSFNSLDFYDKNEFNVINDERSFESCMHGSFHSVLGYCAQVATPTYKKNVDTKLRNLSKIENSSNVLQPETTSKLFSNNVKCFPDHNKIATQSFVSANIAATASTSTSKVFENRNLASTSSLPDNSKRLVIPRRMINFNNVRNVQNSHQMLQGVFGRSTKNTLIFLKPTENPGKSEKISTATKNLSAKLNSTKVMDTVDSMTAELNLTKLDDNAISDEALMEMSSIYKKLLPNDQVQSTLAKPPKSVEDVRRPVTAIVSKKSPSQESKEHQFAKMTATSGFRSENHVEPVNIDMYRTSRFSSTNQASEISKILSEYNEKAAKNSGMRKVCYSSSNSRATSSGTVKLEKDVDNNQDSRSTFLSLMEQPIKPKNQESGIILKQEPGCSKNLPDVAVDGGVVSIKTETVGTPKTVDDDSRAMDLTTTKSREREIEEENETKPNETANRQWLQELIQDTVLLYCAAAGVHQDDVVEYLNTLDSKQSIQWLGS